MTSVAVRLPAAHREGMVSSFEGMCEFTVEVDPHGKVSILPREGSNTTRKYFDAHKLADVGTPLERDEPWRVLATHPPYEKPDITLPAEFDAKMASLKESTELPSIIERLSVETALADGPADLTALLRRELPGLFERYPQGSLWYVSVDEVLMSRLAALRVLFQLHLTPDVPVGSGGGITYFAAHQLTRGVMFADVVAPILLAFSPAAFGFAMSAQPNALVFLFGQMEDLRTHEPGTLSRGFIPGIHKHLAMPGIKVPTGSLTTAHLEALVAWWTTRLNILYSHAADPSRFVTSTGEHDVAEQAGWLLTFERLLADFQVVAAAVDAPGLLRLQGAFDALDKASGLLKRPNVSEAEIFKLLLSRSNVLPRIRQGYQELPIQLQPRFSAWAEQAFDRFYDELLAETMPSRRGPSTVRVGLTSPTDLHDMSLDDYVATLVREARNASHGLTEMLGEPTKPGKRQRRLVLATNQGEMPASFYEVMRAIVFGLLADSEALCSRTW